MYQNRLLNTVRLVTPHTSLGSRWRECLREHTSRKGNNSMDTRTQNMLRPGMSRAAFTLIEMMIVLVILAITAAMAVPMISSGAGMQVRSAANVLAADLEYAKSMAITNGSRYSVVFDTTNETYQIEDSSGSPIEHPVKLKDYVVDFPADSRLSQVNIVSADFDGQTAVTFDYLGSPWTGFGSMNSGIVTLQAGNSSKIVNVEAVTGFVSVSD